MKGLSDRPRSVPRSASRDGCLAMIHARHAARACGTRSPPDAHSKKPSSDASRRTRAGSCEIECKGGLESRFRSGEWTYAHVRGGTFCYDTEKCFEKKAYACASRTPQ